MDEKHVKTYVDKILKNREKLLSDVNIGGLNINEMLANDAHPCLTFVQRRHCRNHC